MNNDFPKTVFYRAFMTSVFVGIIATLTTMIFDMVFLNVFKLRLSALINVSSLIFGVNIIFLVVGLIYYLFVSSFKKGDLFYIALLVVITVILAWRTEHEIRRADTTINKKFQDLLAGVGNIMGAMAAFLVPYLYHNKKFDDAVL
jgi:hypothetical protein